MSPEQLLSSKDADVRTDVWSLAVVIYVAISGRAPFEGETLPGLCMAICNARFTPPSQLGEGVPPALDPWFARALRVDPEQRFGSIREAVEAFAEAVRAHRSAAAAVDPIGPQPTPPPIEPPTADALAVIEPAGAAPASTVAEDTLTQDPSQPRRGWLLLAAVGVLAVGAGGVLIGRIGVDRPQPSPPSVPAQVTASAPTDPAGASASAPTPSSDAPSGSTEPLLPPTGPIGAATTVPPTRSSQPATVPSAVPPPTANRCRKDERCTVRGQCTPQGTKYCIVGSNADCQQSSFCRNSGRCLKGGDMCVARDDAMCRQSADCARLGQCTMKHGICMAWETADCQAAAICFASAKCSVGSGSCVVLRNADCQRSVLCNRDGKCVEDGGRCVSKK